MDQFIDQERQLGESQSQGNFTIAADGAALRKLAKHSSPFKGAWAVKIVQGLVAAGAERIRFKQGKKTTCIHFQGAALDLESLQQAFGRPQICHQSSIGHLVAGLRDVGMKQDRQFDFCLGLNQSLVWDEKEFRFSPSSSGGEARLKIDNLSLAEQKEFLFLVRSSVSSERHSDVVTALRDYCFVCPVPLDVDGLRIDNLLGYPPSPRLAQGRRVVFGMVDLKTDSPKWRLPPHTAEVYQKDFDAEFPPEFKEPTALTVLSGMMVPDRRELKYYWELTPTHSRLFFHRHGAVVNSETLKLPTQKISLQLLLSARDLESDISGFALKRSSELEQRRDKALRAVNNRLSRSSLETPKCESGQKPAAEIQDYVGAGYFGGPLGIGLLAKSLPLALFWVPPVLISALAFKTIRHLTQESVQQSFEEETEDLLEAWQEFFGQLEAP